MKGRKFFCYLIIFISLFFVSCDSNSNVTFEEFENSLIEKGYQESYETAWDLIEPIAQNQSENKQLPLIVSKEKTQYKNLDVAYDYCFVDAYNKATNKYVVVTFFGYDKNNEYIGKMYKKENINNEKGKRYKLEEAIHNKFKEPELIVENPIVYLWE